MIGSPAQTPAQTRVPGELPTKFGPYGGQFVPETLMPALVELEAAYRAMQVDPAFQASWPICCTPTWAGPPR